MVETIVILRTHFVDERLLRFAASLHCDREYRVVLAVDERNGIIDTAPYEKVSLTRERFAELELFDDIDDIFWRAGDYVLYCVLNQYPEAQLFWLIEYDVVINRSDPLSFLREIDAVSTHDLLSAHYREPEDWWRPIFAGSLADVYPKLMRCYYPLVRLSTRAVSYMLLERVRLSRIERAIPKSERKPWANDEAFTATSLFNGGFSCADFLELGKYYTSGSFWFVPLYHPNHLPSPDGLLYHPVRGGKQYLDAIRPDGMFMPYINSKDVIEFYPELDPITLCGLIFNLFAQAQKTSGDDPDRYFAEDGTLRQLFSLAPTASIITAVVQALAEQRKVLCLDWLRNNRAIENWPPIPELDNLALGRPADQSSVSHWSSSTHCRLDAEGGNDGRLDVDFGFHTSFERRPYWTVDLGRSVRLAGVCIFNRRQHWDRLRGFDILLSDDGLMWQITHRSTIDDITPDVEAIRVRLNGRGRYLRIELPNETALHLREIQVFGNPA